MDYFESHVIATMLLNPLTIALTVIGGLVVAGLLGWIRKPRLVVLVPRMFSYSQLTDRGQLVEISVFNRSFKTEEAVDVTMSHMLSYEMLGSNSQDVSVVGNKIQIARIGPADEVTVLLMVEQGTFKRDDIVQCLSKETKGKVVSKFEEVPPTGPQRVGLVAGLVGLPMLMYAATFGLDYLFERSRPVLANAGLEASQSIEVNGWKLNRAYSIASPGLFKDFSTGRIVVAMLPMSKKGDIVTVPVKLQNATDQVLRVDINMMTAASSKRFKSYELTTGEIVLVPGKSNEQSLRVVVPEATADPNEQLVFIEAFVRNTDNDSLILKTTKLAK